MASKSPEDLVADIGKQLAQHARPNKDFLVKKLREAAGALEQLGQLSSLKSYIRPLRLYLVKQGLLHQDKDVRLLVGICFCEIIRILAPNPSFGDKTFKDIFELFNDMFTELVDTRNVYFPRRVKVLETVAMLECSRSMLGLGCEDLILKMFKVFFSVVRNEHQESLTNGMLSIMSLILNEEETPQPLLEVILQNLTNKGEGPAPASYHLAVALVQNCAEKIKPAICRFITSCIVDSENVRSDLKESYHEITFEIFRCAPDMLHAIIPKLVEELVNDQVDVRLKSVNLIGKLLMLPIDGREHHNLFVELVQRFSDKSAEVRINVICAVKTCYMANPSGVESHKILSSLEARLLDIDASVRTEAVSVVCDLAKLTSKFPRELLSCVIDRLRDKMPSVRKETLRKLLEVYREYCIMCSDGQMMLDEYYEQIPCKILMLSFDINLKEFRPQGLELLLAESLFPESLSVEDQTRHWMYLYSLFSPAHIKALNLILCQKRRFQREMQSYLSLFRKEKEIDLEHVNMRIENTFIRISAAFLNPVKAKESLAKLNELKDGGIFDPLLQLLGEPAYLSGKALRDWFLKKIGVKHPHFEFLEALSLKCSYCIFGSEHASYILDHLSASGSRDDCLEESSVKLLSDISRNFPLLLRGSEHGFKQLILEEDFPLLGKLIQILANAGSSISMEVSEIYPILKRLCLEGTRDHAKAAISVIAALVDPSEHFLVEDLCEKLVEALQGDRNIPTVLQSLGCISQYFVLEFQKYWKEVSSYIRESLLEAEMAEPAVTINEISGCEVSYGCKMKIYGVKALVKSFIPKKEAHRKEHISYLLDILSKVLLTAKFADATNACENDVIRLAVAKSVLRLSRRWDFHISPQIFQRTIMMSKDASSDVCKEFLDKIHKLLREHALPSKFACAFALVAASSECRQDLKDASLKYLVEFIKEYRRAAPTCPDSGTEGFSTNCAAYIVVFLLHLLSHDSGFPPLNSSNEEQLAQFCRPLVLVVHLLVDVQSVDGDMELVNQTFYYLLSIFRAVKRAEDSIDADRTPKLHILANVGISILNALKHDGICFAPSSGLVLLPSSLYKISPLRKTEDNCQELRFVVKQHLVMKLFDVFELNFAQFSSTAKRARKSLKDSLQDQAVHKGSVSKHTELSKNVIKRDKVAGKDVAEAHLLEACVRAKKKSEVVHPLLRTSTERLQNVSSAVEEPEADHSENLGHTKLNSNANVELFGSVSDISISLSVSQQDERKRKGSCGSTESTKLSKTKPSHGHTSLGSTVSLLQQRDPKKQRLGDNVKGTVTGSEGTAAERKGLGECRGKILLDRTNTLAENGLQKQCQSKKSGLRGKISFDTPVSDVSDVSKDSIAFRTRRRKV